jgi:hypothetical protein
MDEFASVAEHALGSNTLDRFIVTNDHDNSVLRDIRKQAGCQQDCGVFQVHPSSSRFRIPAGLGIEGIERVSSVFTIDNDLVFNCVVDNTRMEKKAVARDRRYSQEQLLVKNSGRDTIRANIQEVYLLPRGDYWTVKGGSLAMFSNEKLLRQTIGVDRTAAIADAQAEESKLQAELHVMQQEEAKVQIEHTQSQREWNRAKKAVQSNDALIRDITEQIDVIKDDMKSSTKTTYNRRKNCWTSTRKRNNDALLKKPNYCHAPMTSRANWTNVPLAVRKSYRISRQPSKS